ncbi:two-component system regulatory protein YycI [Staphylococcus aureus]|nr:two-component system regulatory protein YycI [Staphylococcus aureus]CXT82067.1 yycH family protein [Staphylococcus aureus]
MNWKLTKTLFIFVFILVNIVLVSIYVNKVNRSHINEVESNNEVNFQQEEIRVPASILNKSVKGIQLEQITGRSKDFSSKAKGDSDLSTSDSGKLLNANISQSVKVSDNNLKDLKDYVNKRVFKGAEYQLSEISSDSVKYEQTYDDFPILNNSKAMLNFKIEDNKAMLNFKIEDNKATSYKQSMMDDIKPTDGADKKHQVISVRKAIEALYYNRYLKKGDEVINARLGYYSVVNETNVQLLQPNWEIKVKHDGKDKTNTYYVEATNNNPKIINH